MERRELLDYSEERLLPSEPVLDYTNISAMKAELDRLGREATRVELRRRTVDYHFQQALKKNALIQPPETAKQMSRTSEMEFGGSGFEER